MSNAASLRFSCSGCNKSYGFKPELANKKVKCKCGTVITVPDLAADADEGMYDIADEPKVPVAKPARVAAVAAPRGPVAAAPAARGKPQVLGYKSGPTARERETAQANNIYDLKRDFYIPAALIAISFLVLMASLFSGMLRMGDIVPVTIAFTILCLINAAVMLGGALFIGGKVGISFGEPLTAILKFLGIAFFVGILTTIVDEKFDMLGIFVFSPAIAAVLYTLLFIYLFSMDAEDSIWMVCLFIALRTALSLLLFPILMSALVGGATMNLGGGAGPTASAQRALADERIDEQKELGLAEEAVEYIKGGRQSYWKPVVDAAYSAGATHVAFLVARDINGKGTPYMIVIEMPDAADKRAAIIKAVDEARGVGKKDENGNPAEDSPDPLTDEGGQYVEIPIG